MLYDNVGRSGVLIRGVTRGAEQKDFLNYLRKQVRFKQGGAQEHAFSRAEFPLQNAVDESTVEAVDEHTILEAIRKDVLEGAYYLIDYRGYAGYEPGDNVVNIFAMGSLATEAIKASEALLTRGIYANVIVVTSPDLLCGINAHENDYRWLKEGLGIEGSLHVHPTEQMNGHEFVTVAGRRVPIVSVHDGEPGLLDNLGSIIGVKHEALAVRHHSKCGRPKDIYKYHSIDAESVVEAVGKVLSETALEEVRVSQTTLGETIAQAPQPAKWSDLWPTRPQSRH
jgi:pyruvate dehydrogenase E1 component